LKAKQERSSEKDLKAMKTLTTAALALSIMLGSAFAAAQDTTKPATDTKSTTSKVKKHKKAVKSTSAAVKPAAAAPAATASK
jgi:hypothetical protein